MAVLFTTRLQLRTRWLLLLFLYATPRSTLVPGKSFPRPVSVR